MKILYVKNNSERAKEFQLKTVIYEDNGSKFIKKQALCKEAIPHLKKMKETYLHLQNIILDTRLKPVKIIDETEDSLVFEYIEGISLQKKLLEAIGVNEQEVSKVVKDYIQILKKCFKTDKFKSSNINKKFLELFGSNDYIEFDNQDCFVQYSNIDLIFSNFIYKEDSIYIIDYEWVFEVDVPIDYIIYRNLAQQGISSIFEYIKPSKIYGKMENHFISNFISTKEGFFNYAKQYEKEIVTLESLYNTIRDKDRHIESQNKLFIQQVEQLKAIAQSLRIKNRIKAYIKKFVPLKLLKLIKIIKNNPSYIRQGINVLKNEGLSGLKRKIQKAEHLSLISNQYLFIQSPMNDEVQKNLNNFSKKPKISIIMPVYNVDPKWIDLAINSIQKQWYKNWELCIADDCSTNKDTIEYLKNVNDPRIKIKFLENNQNISGASNEALKLVSGEYVALMDNDDELTTDALYEVVKAINESDPDLIYSDEDKIEIDGTYSDPHFKPDFSYELFLSQNYMSHFGIIKKEIIDKIGGFTIGLEGSQDYDLYLKVLDITKNIYHISKVLYHWRKIPGSTAAEYSDKSYAQDAGKKALQNYLQRNSISANVNNGQTPGTYKVFYDIQGEPLISIIIPFKDQPKLLKQCIDSILKKSTYTNFEIIGISNNSSQQDTFSLMKKYEKSDQRIKFYEYNISFNYSKINNYALNYCSGEHLVFLNNDIEIISENWIEELLTHSQREDVGAVGAKLYFPNNTIQHAGIAMAPSTMHGVILLYQGLDRNDYGYISRLKCINNYSAVTAACMMVKKDKFIEVGKFDDENLQIAFNDVDLCLNLQEKGYRNIYTPYCEAYHYESASRGYDISLEKLERLEKEKFNLKQKHKHIFNTYDPYYNQNLSLKSVTYEVLGIHTTDSELYQGIPFSEDILYQTQFDMFFRNEICVFSHFDSDGIISDEVVYYLKELDKFCDIIFVSTSEGILNKEEEISKLTDICKVCIVKSNYGYDFGSWKTGLNYIKEQNIKLKTLILCNDSVIGPLFDLKDIFENMQKKSYDIWSMTDNFEIDYHLQSYFTVYNQKALEHNLVQQFWDNFKIYKDKQTLIEKNEIAYSKSLIECEDFNTGAYCSSKDVSFVNMLHYYWKDIIINNKFPFIKKELIRDNPKSVNIKDMNEVVKNYTKYDVQLLQKYIDRVKK